MESICRGNGILCYIMIVFFWVWLKNGFIVWSEVYFKIERILSVFQWGYTLNGRWLYPFGQRVSPFNQKGVAIIVKIVFLGERNPVFGVNRWAIWDKWIVCLLKIGGLNVKKERYLFPEELICSMCLFVIIGKKCFCVM